jgi:hypothetical protein
MLTYIVIGIVVLLAMGASGFRTAEKAALASYVATEPDSMTRMMKVQTITQLDNIQDDFLRQKVISSIIQK